MLELFVIGSFVLHALSFLFIIILYTRLSHLKEIEQRQAAIVREIEQITTGYLLEMKEQNDAFIQRVRQISNVPVEKPREKFPEARVPTFESASAPTEKDLDELLLIEPGKKNAYKGSPDKGTEAAVEKDKPLEEQVDISELTTDELKKMIISLQKRGLTTEEIAKYLHRGKTEIELMLRFQTES